MSSEQTPNRRTATRFLTDLDAVICDLSENILDESAHAHDITPQGFRAETKATLKEGDKFRFSLDIEGEDPIEGQAKAVWVGQNPWGWLNVGAKITHISWRDRRRLGANVVSRGYDFAGLAKMAGRALFWLIIVAGLDNIAFHQPLARGVLVKLWSVMVALFFFAWGLLLLFGKA
jgi:hypothetical protein